MKAIISSEEWEALSEQAEYTKMEDGRYLLKVEAVEGFSLEDVAGLKSSLSKERTNAKTAETALKKFEGLDADKARAAIEKAGAMDDWTPQDKVAEQIKHREEQLVTKHTKEMTTLTETSAHLQTQLEKHLVEASAVNALNKHKGSVELLLPHVKANTRVEQDGDGNFIAQVVDSDGHPRISMKQGSTSPMTIDELVESMKDSETYAPAFAGSGASGGGAFGNRAGSAGNNGLHILSLEDSRDPLKYRAAKAAAEKAGTSLDIRTV